jgi:hypothetical protein
MICIRLTGSLGYDDGFNEQEWTEIAREDRRIRTKEIEGEKINISGNVIRFDGKWVCPPQ